MSNNLGNVLLEMQRLDEAIAAYQSAVAAAAGSDGTLSPEAAEPLNNLGIVYRRQHRFDLAEASLRRAIEAEPRHGNAWYNLSEVLIDQGRVNEGLMANSRAITLMPRDTMGRDQVIRALILLGERDKAAELYREWLVEDPDNPVVQHQLAACLGQGTPERASDAYVEAVFDNFAQSFDAKLEKLHYRAPQLVSDAMAAALGAPQAALDIADLGCGTGLCGPLLRPWARRLVGCDLSVGMLRKARVRRCYDKLHKAELVYYLDTQPGEFDALVSADTLCYFGVLDAVAVAAHKALRPGGWLVFTVEALAEDDTGTPGEAHRLQPHGRYAHARSYLQRCLTAAGFAAPGFAAEPLREEAGKPVDGWVVVVQRPR
jgi:predicted TPR repeat methyltransferase